VKIKIKQYYVYNENSFLENFQKPKERTA